MTNKQKLAATKAKIKKDCKSYINFIKACFNPFPNQKFYLDSSKSEDCADNNFKFDDSGRKFYKMVENTVEKGEIAKKTYEDT